MANAICRRLGGVRRVEVLFGGWDLSEAGVNMAAACGDCLQGNLRRVVWFIIRGGLEMLIEW